MLGEWRAVGGISFAPAAVEATPLADGGMILRSPQRLEPYARAVGEWLEHWARETPDQLFLAERDAGGGWRRLTYGQTLILVHAIAQGLLDRGLAPGAPIVILSDNAIDHALLALGAMHIGQPVAPISPAYSLLSRDFAKLRHIAELLHPALVYCADGGRFARAIDAAGLDEAELVVSANPPGDRAVTRFADLAATPAGPAVAEAFAKVGPDTIAKILFTSGSTDLPKGVVNTQRMLCSNQQAIVQLWPFLSERPPAIVDWLPWSHTFGGNHNFNMMLRHGGSLYIDEGKPAPGLVEKTVANLREVSPTLYFNVPRGYDMLLPSLERDEQLREMFFRRLDLLFYAGAALPQNLWTRLEQAAMATRGRRVAMVSAWGATETAPMVTAVHFEIDHAGVIGLPAPGTSLKLVPAAGRYELRIKGPNVTPGYWRRPDLTAAAFDAEGFYCIGDAGRLADSSDPAKGIEFDGRLAEDFKLMSGTWVQVGNLRVAAIGAGAPVIQDAVVTGHDREEIGLLIFPNPIGCRTLCPEVSAEAPLSVLITHPAVRTHLAAGLQQLAERSTGSSTRIARAFLLDEPPSIDANEITDKGYINQRAVLLRRAALVARLHADPPDPEVIVIG